MWRGRILARDNRSPKLTVGALRTSQLIKGLCLGCEEL